MARSRAPGKILLEKECPLKSSLQHARTPPALSYEESFFIKRSVIISGVKRSYRGRCESLNPRIQFLLSLLVDGLQSLSMLQEN
ncbi:hypothetical protein Y1Q_0019681 [Alligator mississippiensis]|uniref:Uncharacterized protein n=1 Tax=Alligator mississippiensis TaxID=8496 RepID=A0A151PEV3_ALLMI|nr:hypothetical protein Y1Q_0019681 [Alligator mississippiensis]